MLQPRLFEFIAEKLREKSGICLSADKNYLLESRLQPIARKAGHVDVAALLESLMQRLDPAIMHDIVQAMTTNETMFFRDNKPYERFNEHILPDLRAKHPERKHIRIWSAACSTGQEAYTLAICLEEQKAKLDGCRFEIVGSDLCEHAVGKAQSALYSQFEVQRGMPIQMLIKYFSQKEGNMWQLKDELKNQVRFQVHNLLDSPRHFGEFDIIFCRNVLIYFDEKIKRQVMSNLTSVLRKPGYVVLGSAESILGIADNLTQLESCPGVFRLK